jgi:hypothetical protein
MKALIALFLFAFCGTWLPASPRMEQVDTRRTTAHLAALTALTVLPLLLVATADSRPGLRNENTAVAVTLSIPLLVAWPLFFSELSQARRKGVPRSPGDHP